MAYHHRPYLWHAAGIYVQVSTAYSGGGNFLNYISWIFYNGIIYGIIGYNAGAVYNCCFHNKNFVMKNCMKICNYNNARKILKNKEQLILVQGKKIQYFTWEYQLTINALLQSICTFKAFKHAKHANNISMGFTGNL